MRTLHAAHVLLTEEFAESLTEPTEDDFARLGFDNEASYQEFLTTADVDVLVTFASKNRSERDWELKGEYERQIRYEERYR